ncbi:MAG: excinuclease ABC subunit UvrC [Gammaproteobacteria bacterium]|nr:MAG: excinuclease ABC subunit UvrC [Gammaproteobacteria bacterium]
MSPRLSDAFDPKAFLKTLPHRPGVYRMHDAQGELLYVGKARDLKKRVSSYFRASGLSLKTQALVARIHSIDVSVTRTETEALLLEHNLIKAHRPPYNILMRDDKSYPYIFITDHPDYPAIRFRRVRHKKPGDGRYFGPYTNAWAVRETLSLLEKIFRVRQCEEATFRNRTRPCLQHQIGRCSAPCVGLISPEDYQADMAHAQAFLKGEDSTLLQLLADEMEAASQQLNFERAAQLRDQIQALQAVQAQQSIEAGRARCDVFGMVMEAEYCVVHVLQVRDGKVVGSRNVQVTRKLDEPEEEVLENFVAQFYLRESNPEVPPEIIYAPAMLNPDVVEEALASVAAHAVKLKHQVRGDRAKWRELAVENARQAVRVRLKDRQTLQGRFEALREALGMEDTPGRLECFDISHTMGEETVASCVVFNIEGPLKSDYRRYKIEGITPGDDYAAMKQALEKRYGRRRDELKLPDVLFIDGGKGQLRAAREVLADLGLGSLFTVGVAKGPSRRPGLETLILEMEEDVLNLPPDSPALHLIQHIRDESHRFAITGHRARREKKRQRSALEQIEGVGPKRRRELLRHFGSLKGLENASTDELQKVPGISRKLAEQIYQALHDD